MFGSNGESLDLGTSPVENAVGGSSSDIITGGSAKNTLSGGPGGSDELSDYGGTNGSAVSNPALPDLPASDDTYKGFTSGTGLDRVFDVEGTADKLDFRPLESTEVSFETTNLDISGPDESLKIVINDTTSVLVVGHFSPIFPQDNGCMEQIIFSNEVVTSAASMM